MYTLHQHLGWAVNTLFRYVNDIPISTYHTTNF